MSDEAPRIGWAAAWMALAALVLLVGGRVDVPGVDGEALRAALTAADAGTPIAGVVGMSLVSLVGVRLAAAMLGVRSGRARASAFGVYLVLTAIQAAALAVWLESLSTELWFDLVREPGMRFRLIATLTWLGGASILYWLADRIDATRATNGALAIALLATLLELMREAITLGARVEQGLVAYAPLAAAVLVLVPALLVTVRPPAWPVAVLGDLELRSALDAIAVPLASWALASQVLVFVPGPELARVGVALAGTVGVAVLLTARGSSSPRRYWPALVGLVVAASIAAPFAFSAVTSGALARLAEPGPLAGQARFSVTLEAIERFEDGEAEAMVQLIEALGARARVASASPARITLRVEEAIGPEAVLEALRPHTLALHLVIPIPEGAALPPGAAPPTGRSLGVEGACDTLRAWAERVPCSAAVEVASSDPLGERCTLYCLEEPPVLTARDFVDARVSVSEYDGRPYVLATVRDAARFERVTSDNVGRQLAIVLDDAVTSAPVIQSAIPGGQLQITLGTLSSPEAQWNEARTLAETLAGTPLRSAWVLEAVSE